MPTRLRTIRLLTVLPMLLALLGVIGPVGAQDQGKLVVYSGRSETLMGDLFEAFTQDTGIQVEVRYGNTAEMAATILEEGANSPADVYIAQDGGALGALAAEGRLLELSAEILERVPSPFRSPDGLWVGLSGRVRILVYNTDQVEPEALPASILDLTGPEWKGRVGWAPTNGSFQSQVTAMRVVLGEDVTRAWLEGMVANETKVYSGNNPILRDVADGAIAAGLINHYYVWQLRAQTPDVPVEIYYFPKGDLGSLINVAGAGIVDTTRQPELAQQLIAYLLEPKAQEYFAERTYEYPLVAGIEVHPELKPLEEIEAPELDLSQLSDLRGTLDLLRETNALP